MNGQKKTPEPGSKTSQSKKTKKTTEVPEDAFADPLAWMAANDDSDSE